MLKRLGSLNQFPRLKNSHTNKFQTTVGGLNQNFSHSKLVWLVRNAVGLLPSSCTIYVRLCEKVCVRGENVG